MRILFCSITDKQLGRFHLICQLFLFLSAEYHSSSCSDIIACFVSFSRVSFQLCHDIIACFVSFSRVSFELCSDIIACFVSFSRVSFELCNDIIACFVSFSRASFELLFLGVKVASQLVNFVVTIWSHFTKKITQF